jgi:hypothetical protein
MLRWHPVVGEVRIEATNWSNKRRRSPAKEIQQALGIEKKKKKGIGFSSWRFQKEST